jgi:hypothetical protein
VNEVLRIVMGLLFFLLFGVLLVSYFPFCGFSVGTRDMGKVFGFFMVLVFVCVYM